ncbi:MAG: F0F1 ATP synthase subunit B [Treponema sp.]|jgi:F-type H+-transporting ATPase subunit b|nr:F0F1 ATP synthase subunit B [Treponema sp.]
MIVPSLATFLVTIVNITILFFVLRAFLFKPVAKFMEDRTNKVRASLDQAEQERVQAKGLLQQYEDQLRRIDEEATELLRAARESARAEADRIIAEGKAQAARLLEKGRKQLEAEQRSAVAVFRANAAALALNAAGKLIRRELNSDDNRFQAELLLKELADGALGQQPGPR